MDFKKVFAVLIVALFLLSCISFAYAGDSSEDMGYDVVQTDDYSSSGYDVVQTGGYYGSGVVQSEGYKLNSFVKTLYVYGDFIKGIVDLEDYSQVAKGEMATPLNKEDNSSPMYDVPSFVKKKGGKKAGSLEWYEAPHSKEEKELKKKLSDEKNLYEKNFNNIISNFKEVPYLQNHNFWIPVILKYDSFKKNMDKANEYLCHYKLDLASKCIEKAKTDYMDMTVHVVNYHKNYYSVLDRLDKVEEVYKKVCANPDVRGDFRRGRPGKLLVDYSRSIGKTKAYIRRGDLDSAHRELNNAQRIIDLLKKQYNV